MMAISFYCVRCRASKTVDQFSKKQLKNGRPAAESVCPTCGTKMFKILSAKDAAA